MNIVHALEVSKTQMLICKVLNIRPKELKHLLFCKFKTFSNYFRGINLGVCWSLWNYKTRTWSTALNLFFKSPFSHKEIVHSGSHICKRFYYFPFSSKW